MMLRQDVSSKKVGISKVETSQELRDFKNHIVSNGETEENKQLNNSWNLMGKSLRSDKEVDSDENLFDAVKFFGKFTLNSIPHAVIGISENKTREQILTGKLNREQMYNRAVGKDSHSQVASKLIKSALNMGADPTDPISGDVVKFIVGLGSQSAISYGIQRNNYNGIKTLLNSGLDADRKVDGFAIIHTIFNNYIDHNDTINMKLAENKNKKDGPGKSEIDPKCMELLKEYVKLNRNLIQKLAINKTKDINVSSDLGENAMHYLATSNDHDKEIFKMLVDRGIDLNKKNYARNTPLHTAATYGNTFLINEMKGTIANPNIQNKEGMTPLHIAALANQSECFDTLVKMGADPTIKDNRGKTPFYYFEHDKFLLKFRIVGSAESERNKQEQVNKYVKENRGKYQDKEIMKSVKKEDGLIIHK